MSSNFQVDISFQSLQSLVQEFGTESRVLVPAFILTLLSHAPMQVQKVGLQSGDPPNTLTRAFAV